jgi:hypothetical protein
MPNELWGTREAACAVRTGHRFFNGFCLDCEAPARDGYWSASPMLKIFTDLLACEANVAKLLSDLAIANEVATKARAEVVRMRADAIAETVRRADDEHATRRAKQAAAERLRVVDLVKQLVVELDLQHEFRDVYDD